MTDSEWHLVEGMDTAIEKFPARATLNGEGILIFKSADRLRGVQRRCPHQQATLSTAAIFGNGNMLRCAQHNYVFSLTDGKGVNCPGYSLAVYEVKEESGALYGRRVSGQAT